jgi:hypothetical protein
VATGVDAHRKGDQSIADVASAKARRHEGGHEDIAFLTHHTSHPSHAMMAAESVPVLDRTTVATPDRSEGTLSSRTGDGLLAVLGAQRLSLRPFGSPPPDIRKRNARWMRWVNIAMNAMPSRVTPSRLGVFALATLRCLK